MKKQFDRFVQTAGEMEITKKTNQKLIVRLTGKNGETIAKQVCNSQREANQAQKELKKKYKGVYTSYSVSKW